jgi:hypothetical protein
VSRLPGSDRCYVHIEGEFSYAKWIEGLRAGRSFVTNGPFVELIVGGQRPGGSVKLSEPGKTKVTAKAWWHLPLRRAELVQDGKVIATKEFAADGPREQSWEQEIPIEQSGWVALRTMGASHPDNPGGEAYAHTSPVYFEVAGRPASARTDAQFFVEWINRLETALRERERIPTQSEKAQVLAQLEAARAVYVKIGGR